MLTPESVRSPRRYSLGSNLGSASLARERNNARESSGARRSSNSSATWTVRDYEEDEPGAAGGDEVSMEPATPMDYDDDDDGEERNRLVERHASGSSSPRLAPKFDGGGDDDDDAMVARDGAEDDASAGNGVAAKAEELAGSAQETVLEESAASRDASAGGESAMKESEAIGGTRPRSRFERMKETNAISVTAAAEAVLRPNQDPASDKSDAAGDGGDAGKGALKKADHPGGGYMPSLDFQGPQYSLSEAPSTPAGALPSTSSWLRKVRGRSS